MVFNRVPKPYNGETSFSEKGSRSEEPLAKELILDRVHKKLLQVNKPHSLCYFVMAAQETLYPQCFSQYLLLTVIFIVKSF